VHQAVAEAHQPIVALGIILARERAAVFGGRARFTSIGLFAEI